MDNHNYSYAATTENLQVLTQDLGHFIRQDWPDYN